jgi:hypothetical protein
MRAPTRMATPVGRDPVARAVVLTVAILVTSPLGSASAAAPPQPTWGGAYAFDPLWERVVFGPLPVPEARAVDARPIATRGRFVERQAALRLVEAAPLGESTWIPSQSVTDGLVRARFLVGSRLDASVLVRASVGAEGQLLSGYAVSVEKNILRLHRYQHQLPRSLGAEARIEGPLVSGSVLEVVVVLNGPFIDATVFDGATLQPRARAYVRDRAYSSGRVGVRFHRAQDADSGLALLSVGGGPHDLAAADEGAGPERLAVFPAEQVARLPSDLKKRVLETRDGSGFLVTDVLGVERARRAGVTPLRISSAMPWKYVDPSLRARIGKPPTATASGLRLDEGYKDAEGVEAILRAYAARFPHISRLEEIGRSLEDRPILALKISKNPALDEDEPAVLLDGGHHGGELMAVEFALDAIQQLLERYQRDPLITSFVDRLAIWVVPLVNPDGNMRFIHVSRDHDRKNARDVDENGVADPTDGVDLYRNYPIRHGALGEVGSRSLPQHSRYRGKEPASEPEVRAIIGLARRERFVASIDFHTNGTLILVPYTDPGMKNPEPNEAWTIAEEIAARLPVQVNGKKYAVQRNMYPVDGTCQDWLRHAHGTVALLVEGPTNNPLPFARGRPPAVVGTRPTWLHLFERVVNGPGLVVRVRDEAGAPLEAEVVIDELALYEGESWTTRPRDGRHQRLLAAPGSYTVRVRAPGHGEKVKRVTVERGTVAVDVQLARSR